MGTELVVDAGLRLSALRALLGAVGPNVRMVKVSRVGEAITFTAIVATNVSDEEREALSEAATGIVADYACATIHEELVLSDAPLPREDVLEAGWVFERLE
jgi:hypothetical protein